MYEQYTPRHKNTALPSLNSSQFLSSRTSDTPDPSLNVSILSLHIRHHIRHAHTQAWEAHTHGDPTITQITQARQVQTSTGSRSRNSLGHHSRGTRSSGSGRTPATSASPLPSTALAGQVTANATPDA